MAELGEAYQGIGLAGATDELIYLARVDSLTHGESWTLNSIFNVEHADSPWLFGFVGEWVTALVSAGLGLNPTRADVLLTFVFPIGVFWLAAALVYRLSGSWRLSGLWSTLLILGYYFVTATPRILVDLLQGRLVRPLWFVRSISPQFSYLLLLGGLLLIYRAVERESRASALGAGLLTGALVYTFFHHWTFLCAGVGVLGLVGFLTSRRAWVETALIVLTVTAVLSIPYWVNNWKVMHHPNYGYLAERDGLIMGRTPFLPLPYVVGSVLVILVMSRGPNLPFWFVTSFLLGGLICLNQQLLSGATLQPGHWQNYSLKTFLLIAAAAALGQGLAPMRKKLPNAVATSCTVAGIVVLAGLGVWQQNQYYRTNRSKFAAKQPLAQVMRWLNANTTPNTVTLTDPMNAIDWSTPTRIDVLAYSHTYVYLPSFSDTLISREEVEDRYMAALHFFNYSAEEAQRFFTYREGLFLRSMGAVAEFGGTPLSPHYARHLRDKYRAVRQQNPMRALKRFRLDYVLVTVEEAPRLASVGHLRRVYDDGQYVLFRLS